MQPFLLACLTYLAVALPGSTLGLLWPSVQSSFHVPVSSLGILLVLGTVASVASSAGTGRLLARPRTGPVLAAGSALVALALALEAFSPSFWVFTGGSVVFGIGFGAIDSALNAHAANYFGARQVNWMHAGYGLGATVGPLLVTALLAESLHWRWAFGAFAIAMGVTTLVLASGRKAWRESLAALSPAPAPLMPKQQTTSPGRREPPATAVAGTVVFTAIFTAFETGIESGAGVWGYIFLTDGRGLSHGVAGLVLSAYWAMMVLGRVVLGPVAERAGARGVLGAAVGGVAAGAALMSVPGSPALAVAGMIALGLAAAPVFPLITLTTSERLGGPAWCPNRGPAGAGGRTGTCRGEISGRAGCCRGLHSTSDVLENL